MYSTKVSFYNLPIAVGTFGIAYIMTKFTEPLRLAVTIGIVPKIASILGRRQQEEENEQQK